MLSKKKEKKMASKAKLAIEKRIRDISPKSRCRHSAKREDPDRLGSG